MGGKGNGKHVTEHAAFQSGPLPLHNVWTVAEFVSAGEMGNQKIVTANKYFENMEKFKYLGT